MEASTWFAPMRLGGIAVLIALGMVAVFIEAAPLGLAPDAYPSPDILFCIVAYWSVRRPDLAALLAVFALGLARDLLTDVPAGAGVLSLVLASEFLKALGAALARRNFATEWLLLATVMAATLIGQWVVVLLMVAQPPYLVDLARQWLATMALYPVLALILRWLFRIGWRRTDVT